MKAVSLRIRDVGCQADPEYKLHLHVGVQSFPISGGFDSLDHVIWYATMMARALRKTGSQAVYIVNDDWEVLPERLDYQNPWTTEDDAPSLFDEVD